MDANAEGTGSENARTPKAEGNTFRTCARSLQRGGGIRSVPAQYRGKKNQDQPKLTEKKKTIKMNADLED